MANRRAMRGVVLCRQTRPSRRERPRKSWTLLHEAGSCERKGMRQDPAIQDAMKFITSSQELKKR